MMRDGWDSGWKRMGPLSAPLFLAHHLIRKVQDTFRDDAGRLGQWLDEPEE
jgi:hypothetical protein